MKQCLNGHPMEADHDYCPRCGAQVASEHAAGPGSPPSGTATTRPMSWALPRATLGAPRSSTEITAAFACGVIALVVAFGFMFATPHASFTNYANSGNGATTGTANTSCITPWSYVVGDSKTVASGAVTLETQSLQAASPACVTAIHDREYVALVLLVVGAVPLILGIVWLRRREPADTR
jgi:hypothetical protein